MTVSIDAGETLTLLGQEGCIEALRRMWRIRVFEREVSALVSRGEVRGSMHSSAGQEATQVGACMAVRTDDYMTGTHRSHGHPIAKGARLDRLMAELFGSSAGVCRGKGGTMHLADFSVGSLGESAIVAASVPVAVGAGLAASLRGEDRVCLAFFGDGAANEGVWHEALNLASVWRLPVVFVCENNGYGVSTPAAQVSAEPRISARAIAYDMPGTTVDGQDVLAVYHAVRIAAERARAGDGPSIVEAMTYRYDDHALGMSPRLAGTRPPGEREAWLARDPLVLFAQVLRERDVLADAEIEAVEREVIEEVAAAVEFARSSPPAQPEQMWPDMFADPSAWSQPEKLP